MHIRFLIFCLFLPVFCFAQHSSSNAEFPAKTNTGRPYPKATIRADTPKYILHTSDAQPASPDLINAKDSIIRPVGPLQLLWNEQTLDGKNIVREKGTAGFFDISGNSNGAQVYAFHSSAARGTVIQVKNLNNGRIAYVKVLGPLPGTKQYTGCIIGLSNGAKALLGVRERKAFCELSYAGY